nr:immunoglobulin light chain junction region [Macaca mulatta]
CQQYDIDSLTF